MSNTCGLFVKIFDDEKKEVINYIKNNIEIEGVTFTNEDEFRVSGHVSYVSSVRAETVEISKRFPKVGFKIGFYWDFDPGEECYVINGEEKFIINFEEDGDEWLHYKLTVN